MVPKCKNSSVQSIRREVTTEELAWLAGIIDGEGNIDMGSKIASTNGKRYLDIKVRVSNTDLRMVRRLSEIYYNLNLRFHFAAVNFNRGTWKPALSVNVTAQGSNKKLLKVVYPYLVTKKVLASIVIKVLDFVSTFPKGGNTSCYNYWEEPKMQKLQKAYQEEKAGYFDPSTTTRRANAVLAFGDIV